ncbi:hypothetical protein SAMN05216489_00066 [Streptomyces sp. 3213]|uniref:tetratricopeptide repeat protein n=1 Tax=Streptomyces sp. 3213.3 TaxID=1855348 RepID=UPI0008991EA9|nr:tetratricopeptide repeat protein [Streptomyces sp. 3213.3]SEC17150.1 hypothetical protein SAMN05216489_00066 [Streptomyces sp. 3213] [Streptomyces sp. 3213.3]
MPGSGQVLRAVQGWDLPERFRELGPKISYDGQVYHRCSACGAETRTHPFFSRAVDMTEARCFDCGPQRHELIVHRAACVLSCADCGTESHVSISGFETLACEHCGSHRLVVESAEIDPPFSPYCRQGYGWDEHGVPPERREQVRNGPKHLWGDSARDDTAEIQREMAPDAMGRSFRPDLFHDACLLAARFIRRLGMFGGYRAEWEIAEAMGCEASLHSHLFGLLSEPQEGIEALELSRTAASLIRHHPDSFAIMESRFAVYAFNLLLEFGDVEVARMYQPGLRAEAIEVAEDALAFFTTGLGGDLPEAPGEAALLRVTLGNLLALRINAVSGLPPEARRWAQTALEAAGAPAGQVPADDLQRAVDYLSEAIGSGELSETGLVSARNTRAGALLGGETPSEDRRRQAIADLEDNAATLESPQGQAAWSRFGNLADLYLTEGRLDEALPLLEKVCALAAVERQHASDVRLVHAQAKEFVFYSDTLALVYARLGRPLDALSALEWSRAATIRFHTMGKAERAKAEQAAQKELVQSALSAGLEFLGEPRKHRETPSFTAELEILRSRVATAHRQWQGGSAHTGFVGFALWNNQVLAVVAGRSVHAHVWDADVISLAAALVGTPMDLSTWREKRFARLFRAAYKVLWQPLADTLKEQELTRLVISAPGTVSSISFEALAALAEADGAPPATVLTYAPPSAWPRTCGQRNPTAGASRPVSVARHHRPPCTSSW